MNYNQELYCHNCNRYVQFSIDLSLDGNNIIVCPNCRHEHCRVVKDGKITEERWGQKNNVYRISALSSSSSSVSDTTDTFLYSSWNSSTTTSYIQAC